MKWLNTALILTVFGFSHMVSAGVIVGGTRVIYDGSKREASLSVKNPEKQTVYLIQSWVDDQDESNKEKAPFIITPPLFRLDAGQENILRIIHNGKNLPDDRESVYWINVKSIPSSTRTDRNQLQITVRSRIKLFYRPQGITGLKADQAYKSLKFSFTDGKLTVTNPTPFYLSFYSLKADGKAIKEATMVAPKSDLTLSASSAKSITWQTITDFGGITKPETVSL